jgi:hypothetical protein
MRGIVGDAFISKKKSVKSPMPSAPDNNNENVEMIDTSANRKPDIAEKSLSSDEDEDQWKIVEPTPKKKDVPKPVPNKKKKDVPEDASLIVQDKKDQSSSFDENEVEFEIVTPSQQEVTNEISKILESAPESEEDKPIPSRPLAIKGMNSILFIYSCRSYAAL